MNRKISSSLHPCLVSLLSLLLLVTSCNVRNHVATPTAKHNPEAVPVPTLTATQPAKEISISPTTAIARPPSQVPNTALLTPSQTPLTPISTQSIVLTGHTGPVTKLSWSPDGSLLASASGDFQSTDDSIRIWRSDGRLAYELNGHTQPVTGLAWSPDGNTLASSSLDDTIRLWSKAGTFLKTLQGHAGNVFAVAWSPDGKVLASGSIVNFINPTVQLWDQAGQIVQTLSTSFSGGKFYNLAWSPDGKYLVGGATDYKLWSADGTQILWVKGCAACTPAWGMAWSPDSKSWAIGDEGGIVKIYTNQGGKIATVRDQSNTDSIAWSPDSRILAGANTLWLADGTTLNNLNGQPSRVSSVDWSPDGKILASGGSDAIVRLWAADGEPSGLLKGHTGPINIVKWSPRGDLLASASDDQTIRLWIIH